MRDETRRPTKQHYSPDGVLLVADVVPIRIGCGRGAGGVEVDTSVIASNVLLSGVVVLVLEAVVLATIAVACCFIAPNWSFIVPHSEANGATAEAWVSGASVARNRAGSVSVQTPPTSKVSVNANINAKRCRT